MDNDNNHLIPVNGAELVENSRKYGFLHLWSEELYVSNIMDANSIISYKKIISGYFFDAADISYYDDFCEKIKDRLDG